MITKHKIAIAIEVLEYQKNKILERIKFIDESNDSLKKELLQQIRKKPKS